MPTSPHVAVIGGGITGLAAAHRLLELRSDARLTLFESTPRLGGVLETVHRDGLLIERSADSFLTRLPWAVDLCQRLGMAHQLLPTDVSRRRAFVVRRRRLLPVPAGFVLMAPSRLMPVVVSPILSPWGKLRLFCEPLVPRTRAAADEGVAQFVTRRLGRQTFERLVQPLLAGIYTADAEQLSMAATMPQFLDQERVHGSLLRTTRREHKNADAGARYGMFVAPSDGMGSLVAALATKLPGAAIQLGTSVESVQRTDNRWRLKIVGEEATREFDAVIISTPAHVAASVVRPAAEQLAGALAQIEHAGSVVVSLAVGRNQVSHPLDGFGFVVPQIEHRQIIAASFASQKFPNRAPHDQVLFRVFVGGALQPELVQLADDELLELVRDELGALIGLVGEPLAHDIARWPQAMPQYHVGHLERVARIEMLVADLPGLELAGNAYHGVGIPQCIHSGEQATERIHKYLGSA